MNLSKTLCFLVAVFLFAPVQSRADTLLHHDLDVKISPVAHRLEASDKLSFPSGKELVFYLNTDLTLDTPPPNVLQITNDKNTAVPVNAYRITPDKGQTSITLHYSGVIQDDSEDADESAGVIAEQGVFLSGASAWYPYVEGRYLSFNMHVTLPDGWLSVSQGAQQKDDGNGWREAHPQEEIYLIAARFHAYSKAAGQVKAMAFLRSDDAALADRYLSVTAQYIEMYNRLIGRYPYAKFALVENFWESGYGMPSFTLLGPRVIRLPFILHSSYPHEILHNWWGNGVYVDISQGNWSEGLTSYLADELIQAQHVNAANFRRSLLQNYADFVSVGRDFPLTEFTARHSSSSEAIGYGKSQMLFHMLRRTLGDKRFVQGLQRLYKQYRFKEASFNDLERVFQTLTDTNLGPFFRQWVQRTGAPQLRIAEVKASRAGKGWRLQGLLEQQQPGKAYQLTVPLAVTLEGQQQAFQTGIAMTDKQQHFSLDLPVRPVRLDVDPEFDLFRRVSRAEIPPALSQAFGADKVLLVLPAKAPVASRQALQSLAGAWQRFLFSDAEVVTDDELGALPHDRTVWLLGSSNRFAPEVIGALKKQGVSRAGGQLTLPQGDYDLARESVVLVARRHPDDQHALVWLAADRPRAIPGLARKLPHYRKYSYLVFSGDAPDNRLKGQWPVLISPMSVRLAAGAEMGELAPRQPLAQLPAQGE